MPVGLCSAGFEGENFLCQANFQPVLTGFGVTPTGGLRQPELPPQKRAKAVLLDDREPLIPQYVDACAEALAEALDSLHRPLLIADFERPFCTAYAALLKIVAPHAAGLAVPEAYTSIPHDFLLCTVVGAAAGAAAAGSETRGLYGVARRRRRAGSRVDSCHWQSAAPASQPRF